MARILNIISQIIGLSKIARKQIERGEVSSTKRLLELILGLEEKNLSLIKKESGSEELYKLCLTIFREAGTALGEFEKGDYAKTKELLDKIIDLETIELGITIKKEGLPQEILKTIDPLIRELVNEINKLSFVKKTEYSCSGHFGEWLISGPYIIIIYDIRSKNVRNITMFHNALLKICGIRSDIILEWGKRLLGLRRRSFEVGEHYPLLHDITLKKLEKLTGQNSLRKEILQRWKAIERVVNKFKDYDRLTLAKQVELIEHETGLLEEDHLFRCPKCEAVSWSKSLKQRCHYCGYRLID